MLVRRGIDPASMVISILEKVESSKRLKERESYWIQQLKPVVNNLLNQV